MDISNQISSGLMPQGDTTSKIDDDFAVSGFDSSSSNGGAAAWDNINKTFGSQESISPATGAQASFSSVDPLLSHPNDHIDPLIYSTLAADMTMMNTDTYSETKRNLQRAATVDQFKQQTRASITKSLEETYFKDFGVLKDHALDSGVTSAPEYMNLGSDELGSSNEQHYMTENPTSQALMAGSAPSDNKVPLMLGAYQHPNFANIDPAAKNLDVNTINSNLYDEATKLLSAGTPLMSTSAPAPKLFQIGLDVNPEVYWQRPMLQTNKKYYVQQIDGKVGLDEELKIKLPDEAQTFAQPYAPYAQDRNMSDLNRKLALPGLNHSITPTKTYAGEDVASYLDYNPQIPPPVGKAGKQFEFKTKIEADAYSEKEGDPVSFYAMPLHASTMTEYIT